MLLVQLLTPTSRYPERKTEGAAGYDLFSDGTVQIMPKSWALIPTGIAIKVPDGTYGRVAPRSGLSVKCGLDVGAGVIDSDYRGEVKVLMFNHGNDAYTVRPGDRIAQLICEVITTPAVVPVDDLAAVSSTARGDGGFGSTGR